MTRNPRDWNWREDAACVGSDPELFACHSDRANGVAYHPKTQLALNICARCPVKAECLQEAVNDTNFAAVGVWGGRYISEKEGNKNLAAARRAAGVAGTHRDYTRDMMK